MKPKASGYLDKLACRIFARVYRRWLVGPVWASDWTPIRVTGWRSAICEDMYGRHATITATFWWLK